jgi:hypothetical protein
MGADLITFMLVGPERIELTKGKRQNILNFCQERVFAAQMVSEGKATSKQEKMLNGLDECDIDNLSSEKPEEALESFLSLWNDVDGGFRDTNSRYFRLGKGKRHQLLVAGDMSWGDEPDGAGYQIVKRANLLGLFPLLGIH